MNLAAIWRYPVKSMHGEPVDSAEVTPHGLAHDRLYAFESPAAPPGMLRLSGPERRNLLRFTAQHTPNGVTVTTPDGHTLPIQSHELLTHLQLDHTFELTESQFPQTDVRPLALISFKTMTQLEREVRQPLDPRRFRANLYLDALEPFAEDALVGRTLAIGNTVRLRILERDPRCRFITYDPANPVATPPLVDLMKVLDRLHANRAGVYASVQQPGTIHVGDALTMQ